MARFPDPSLNPSNQVMDLRPSCSKADPEMWIHMKVFFEEVLSVETGIQAGGAGGTEGQEAKQGCNFRLSPQVLSHPVGELWSVNHTLN